MSFRYDTYSSPERWELNMGYTFIPFIYSFWIKENVRINSYVGLNNMIKISEFRVSHFAYARPRGIVLFFPEVEVANLVNGQLTVLAGLNINLIQWDYSVRGDMDAIRFLMRPKITLGFLYAF